MSAFLVVWWWCWEEEGREGGRKGGRMDEQARRSCEAIYTSYYFGLVLFKCCENE
jgi:hypothetical protein